MLPAKSLTPEITEDVVARIPDSFSKLLSLTNPKLQGRDSISSRGKEEPVRVLTTAVTIRPIIETLPAA